MLLYKMMEEEVITQSTVLTLESSWTEEPGGLLSMESEKSQVRATVHGVREESGTTK